MLEEGNIIYFTPFYFPNGRSAAKPKYCIILKVIDGLTLIASLPTRRNAIPSVIPIQDGCYELPEINLNAFVFTANSTVTTCNKNFDFDTFVYGFQIDSYHIPLMLDLYQIEGTDFEVFGKLKPELYDQLITCLKQSKAVKMKYKRLF